MERRRPGAGERFRYRIMNPTGTAENSPFSQVPRAAELLCVVAVWGILAQGAMGEGVVSLTLLAEGGLVYEGEPIELEVRRTGPLDVSSAYPVLTVFDVDNTTVTTVLIPSGKNAPGEESKAEILRLNPLPRGYYSIVEAGGGTFTKVAVIRGPPAVAAEESPFGVDAFLAWRTDNDSLRRAAARTLRRAGISWVRDRLSWNETQPTSATMRWGRYDHSIDAQHEAGLRVLQVFHDIPAWASSVATGSGETRSHHAPRDPLIAARYFASAARHWNRKVDAWELWNEFDIPVFFEGTPDEYASVLRSAALGGRRGNPEAILLSGSTTLSVFPSLTWGEHTYQQVNAPRFVDRLLASSVGDCFDIWNMHYYGPPDGLVERIRENQTLLENHGLAGKPLWITEMGHTATEKMGPLTDDLERQQAEKLVKACVLALSEGVERIFYFAFPDFLEHGTSAWGIAEAQPDLGTWLPKPALAAYANLISVLSNRTCKGWYPGKNPDLEAFVFGPATGAADLVSSSSVLMAWVREGSGSSVPVPSPPGGWPSGCAILDVYGRRIAEPASPDSVVRAGQSPVIILVPQELPARMLVEKALARDGASPEDSTYPCSYWCEIRTSETLLDFAATSVEGTVRMVNAEPTARRMRLVVDVMSGKAADFSASAGAGFLVSESEWTIPANGIRAVPFYLAFTEPLRPRIGVPFGIRAILEPVEEAVEEPTRTVRFLDVEAPFVLERPGLIAAGAFLASDSDASWGVDLLFQTRLAGRSAAEVELQIPAGRSIPFGLEALRIQTLEYDLPGEGRLASLPICPLSDLGPLSEALGGVPRFRVATRIGAFTREIVVQPEVAGIPHESDRGSLPSWCVVAEESTVVVGADPGGRAASPMRADIRPSWGPSGLHLEIAVEDVEISNPTRHQEPWRGDAMEIFLDFRDPPRLGAQGYDERVFQIFAVPPDVRNPGTSLLFWQPGGTKAQGSRAQLKRSADGRGWGGQIDLDWRDLGIEPPVAGREIGIEFALDDFDPSDSSRRQAVWHGSADDWRDPTVFSRVQLLPAGSVVIGSN